MHCGHFSHVQLCTTLWTAAHPHDPMDSSSPGSSVYGILQARILEWVAKLNLQGIFLTQGLNPRLMSPVLACGFFTTRITREALFELKQHIYFKVSCLSGSLKVCFYCLSCFDQINPFLPVLIYL